MRDAAKAKKEYALVADPAAQDEPSAEPLYIGDIKRYRAQLSKWAVPDSYKELERAAVERNYLRG